MARKKIRSVTGRPFTLIYNDFLESDLLDNNYQKLIFIYLKKYADAEGHCFPSIQTLSKVTKIGRTRVKETLNELEQKGIISKEIRTSQNGGQTSNLYTLYDIPEIWKVERIKDVAEIAREVSDAKMIAALRERGYKVLKEKEPDTLTAGQSDNESSAESNQIDIHNNITESRKSQVKERYTYGQILQFFDYEFILERIPFHRKDVDAVMEVLYSALNTTRDTLRVNGEEKPMMVVVSKLMKLTYEEIVYAVQQYERQTERINNPLSYMLTLLYNAKEQHHLDITNQVAYDMYGGGWSETEETE